MTAVIVELSLITAAGALLAMIYGITH